MKTLSIVGRPNVGKSTLFNRLAKKKHSITQHTPGVTRDRISTEANWRDAVFQLVDTGGLTFVSEGIEGSIHAQASFAIDNSDVILFMVDGSAGVTAEDDQVADLLRKRKKRVYVVVNKEDRLSKEREKFYEFYALGFDKVYVISAEHNRGIEELMKELYPLLKTEYVEESKIKITVLGRPNAGKSSLVNALLGQERNIVSSIPGTTRDVVSSTLKFNDQTYEILDTAGIRRKARVNEDIEYFSVIRSIKSIKEADVAVLVIDSLENVKEQDKKIAGLISDAAKPVVIVLNKSDLHNPTKDYVDQVKEDLYFTHAPVLAMSALTKKNLHKLFPLIEQIHAENHKRISTNPLNNILREIVMSHPPIASKGQKIRIIYGTQVRVAPPVFAIFCNKPELVGNSYIKYIENSFRKAFGFKGIAIRIKIRQS